MESLFSLEYRITEEEALSCIRFAEPKRKIWQPVLLGVLAVLCVVDYFMGDKGNYLMLVLAAMSAVLAVVCLVLPGYLQKQMAKENANAEIPVRVWVYEDGCAFDFAENKRPADSLSLRENGEQYVLFLSAHVYVCVPKRVLTPGQEAELRRLYPIV